MQWMIGRQRPVMHYVMFHSADSIMGANYKISVKLKSNRRKMFVCPCVSLNTVLQHARKSAPVESSLDNVKSLWCKLPGLYFSLNLSVINRFLVENNKIDNAWTVLPVQKISFLLFMPLSGYFIYCTDYQ